MSDKEHSDRIQENDDAMFRPAEDQPLQSEIKIHRIRRDDRGHILSNEPVRMPRENLYYNSDGYIPQENVNYGRKPEDYYFDEEDENPDPKLTGKDRPEPEPESSAALQEDEVDSKGLFDLTEDLLRDRENEELAIKPDEELFEEIREEEAAEEEEALKEDWDEDASKMESSDEEPREDGWASSYIPPTPAEEAFSNTSKGFPKGLRIAAAVFGVLLALSAGTFIALWDLGKTTGELRAAFSEEYVTELSESYLNELRLAAESAEEETVQVITQEEAEETEAPKEESKEEPAEPEPEEEEEEFENSNMEIAGLSSLVSAGNGDEIEIETSAPMQEEGAAALTAYISPDKYYPLAFSEVDEEYFSDALFIGDSRLQGFGMYSGLAATYYCVTSFSVYKYDTMKVVQTAAGKVPIFDALPFDTFTKVYIKIGLNEMGGAEELFYEKYAEIINMLRVYEPRAIIYIHAILPVTAAKSASDKVHNNVNIYARNERLREFATEQKAYFVEVSEDLLDEEGNLIPEATADGIHLKAKYMEPWKEQLMRQAVVIPQ